jgi:hypothetical protein
MKKYPDLNEIQEQLVISLWHKDYGQAEIALALGCSYSPILRVIRKFKLTRTPEQRAAMLKSMGKRNAIKVKALKKPGHRIK